ncbi:hypothetical protein [Paramicrobacterium chengjingii]|uniref:hypothetical protein n=1 Tax=Paramicrobacterium chengjingii TaxID=2769067 RepID=UPI00142005C8|nr:hypothetical protein [Microbacterium chengjingii]
MAGLNWVRVDAALARNHKTLALLGQKGGDRALNTYVFGLGHSAEQGTDGFIPTAALGLIHGTPKTAEMLIEVGLWNPIPGGWNINDYAEYQPSDEESQKRADKARRAAEVRWSKRQASK